MRLLFAITLLLASMRPVDAHGGYENTTEVRLYSDSMRVIVRTSIPFAWAQLGDRAPAMADEAGREIARPLLKDAAASLFEITAGGEVIQASSVDCLFEVENDVAFVLNFPRPKVWPLAMRATFMGRLGSLDTGTVSVFDYSASRFSRDLKPIAEKTISQRDPSISFSPGAASREENGVSEPAAVPPPPAVRSGHPIPWPGILTVVVCGLLGLIVIRVLKRS